MTGSSAVRKAIQNRVISKIKWITSGKGRWGVVQNLEVVVLKPPSGLYTYLLHYPSNLLWRTADRDTTNVVSCSFDGRGGIHGSDRVWLSKTLRTAGVPGGPAVVGIGSPGNESQTDAARSSGMGRIPNGHLASIATPPQRRTKPTPEPKKRASKKEPAMGLLDVKTQETRIIEKCIRVDKAKFIKLLETCGDGEKIRGKVAFKQTLSDAEEGEFFSLFDNPEKDEIIITWEKTIVLDDGKVVEED